VASTIRAAAISPPLKTHPINIHRHSWPVDFQTDRMERSNAGARWCCAVSMRFAGPSPSRNVPGAAPIATKCRALVFVNKIDATASKFSQG